MPYRRLPIIMLIVGLVYMLPTRPTLAGWYGGVNGFGDIVVLDIATPLHVSTTAYSYGGGGGVHFGYEQVIQDLPYPYLRHIFVAGEIQLTGRKVDKAIDVGSSSSSYGHEFGARYALNALLGAALYEARIYGLVGVQFSDIEFKGGQITRQGTTFVLPALDDTVTGLQLGAGMDFRLMPDIRIGIEYRYSTGKIDKTGRVISEGTSQSLGFTHEMESNQIGLRLSHHF